MVSDILVQLGQVGTLVIGSIGICVALVNQRRQLNAQRHVDAMQTAAYAFRGTFRSFGWRIRTRPHGRCLTWSVN
jgi:hypothetical protein